MRRDTLVRQVRRVGGAAKGAPRAQVRRDGRGRDGGHRLCREDDLATQLDAFTACLGDKDYTQFLKDNVRAETGAKTLDEVTSMLWPVV